MRRLIMLTAMAATYRADGRYVTTDSGYVLVNAEGSRFPGWVR